MSLALIFIFLIAIAIYWVMTQILPERHRTSLIRPTIGQALLASVNESRHRRGLPLLEMDEELMAVAENKAAHQVMTGLDEEGWEYPPAYAELFGQSLLMESLLQGPLDGMADKIARQRFVLDEDWISCGIGVAGGQSGQVVVAMILCREAWEPYGGVEEQLTLAQRILNGAVGSVRATLSDLRPRS
jgi:hypothetical protein